MSHECKKRHFEKQMPLTKWKVMMFLLSARNSTEAITAKLATWPFTGESLPYSEAGPGMLH